MTMRTLTLLALLFAQPVAAQWVVGPPMPAPRSGAAVAVLDGKIYVIGGRGPSGYPLDTAVRYDPETQQWSDAGVLDHGRVNGSAVILDGRLLVTGGRREDGNVLDDVEEYVPASNTWFESSQCSNEREGHAAFVIGNTAFTLGGTSEGGSYLGDAEWYQYGGAFWLSYTPWSLAIPRASFGAAPAGEGVLVMGGFSTFGPLADVEFYAPGQGGASRAPLPTPRGAHGAATIVTPDGERVYVAGGRDATSTVLSRVDVYDPVADAWSGADALPAPREAASVVALGGRLYVIGGRDGAAATATTFVLDVATAAAPGPGEAAGLSLGAPVPNPTSASVRVALDLAEAGPVEVEAFDALGRRVATLHDGVLPAGRHELLWTGRDVAGRDLPAGVYALRARQGDAVVTRRLTVTR